MKTIANKAIAINNGVEKTKAIPVKKRFIETKNGLREMEKTPAVISLPRLLGFKPKRSEVLNS